jgi:23S rRNA (guanosine2251-2'-O)-methyltransferase
VAFLLGHEAGGLAPELIASADARVTIPMAGATQSLNVGVAAGVLLFEAARQRRAAR